MPFPARGGNYYRGAEWGANSKSLLVHPDFYLTVKKFSTALKRFYNYLEVLVGR